MPSEKAAAKAETEPNATVTVEWEGIKLKIPATTADLDPDWVEAMENGKAITAMRALFGNAGYEGARNAFERKYKRRPTMKDIDSLAEVVAVHFGFSSAGE